MDFAPPIGELASSEGASYDLDGFLQDFVKESIREAVFKPYQVLTNANQWIP
jgi:hypothetical protein